MNTDSPKQVTLTAASALHGALEDAAERVGLRLQALADERATVTLMDTVDGRVFRSGAVLYRREGEGPASLHLRSRRGEAVAKVVARKLPGFVSEFPESALRTHIGASVGVRKVLPLVRWSRRRRRFALLDALDKTVVRLDASEGELERLYGGDRTASAPYLLTIEALLGYERDAERLRAALGELVPDIDEAPEPYGAMLERVGLDPKGVSNKAEVQLDPEMRTDAALARILDALRAVMERTEEGMRADLDSEFLHDFRVSVRKTRSLLARLKRAFAPEPLEDFRQAFARIGALTGPTRDMDVYLIKMDDYRAGLPPSERSALDSLEAFLVREQRREQRRMVRGLARPEYRRSMDAWAAFLAASHAGDAPPLAERPILEVASETIWRQARKVRKGGRAIHDETPPEALHRLRIECKKLRYLLEAFRSLYDPEGMGRLIGSLKRLQDNLGDFNDFDVQIGSLRRFAERMTEKGQGDPHTLLVMGRLIERLDMRLDAERHRFRKRWAHFDTEPHWAFARKAFSRRSHAPLEQAQ